MLLFSNRYRRCYATVITLYFISSNLDAQEQSLKLNLKSTGYIYNTEIGTETSEDNQALALIPTVTGSYASNRIKTSLVLKNTNVIKNDDAEDNTKSYTDIRYVGQLTLLENFLFLTTSAAQNYRSYDPNESFVSDEILKSGDLTKTNQYNGGLNFTTPNPKFVGLDMQTAYSASKSDRFNGINGQALDNKNILYSAQLFQGRNFSKLAWNISATKNNTSRVNFTDFKSLSLNGKVDFTLFKDTRFVVVGSKENYDLDETDSGQSRTNINSSSVGAGLEWTSRSDRKITITFNELTEKDNKTNYIGIDTQWAFTNRTGIDFQYGKRFYGDAWNFNLNHNTKHFRTHLRYGEDVTSYSLSNLLSQDIGVFVCPIGVDDLSQCYQPDSLEYLLETGEEFRNLFQLDLDIREEVLLNKSASLSLGYVTSKLTLALDLNYRDTQYLESNNTRQVHSLSLTSNYKLGRTTDLGFDVRLSKNESNSDYNASDNIQRNDETRSSEISLTRNLNANLKASAKARYLERDSNNEAFSVKDKRLSFTIEYTF